MNEGYASVPRRCASIMLLLLQTAAGAPSCCNAPTMAGSMVGFLLLHCLGHMLAQHSCAVSCHIPCNFTCQDTEISKPHVGKAFPGCEPYARVDFEIRTCLCVGLNGRLKKAPGADGIQNFHADQIALKPIGLAVLGHLIFLHFGESGAAIFVQCSCQTHQ